MRSLRVTIADIPFDIGIEDAFLRRRVKALLSTYLRTDRSIPAFKIILKGAYAPARNAARPNGPVMVEKRGGQYWIVEGRKDTTCRPLGGIDLRRNICRFTLDGSFHFSLVISVIRTCFLFFLERHNGFFLHASSGIVGGAAYTFTGKSDSGKTTALGNLVPEQVLAEDALAVRVAGRKARVYAIPFRGDRNACAPAKAVLFPRKFPGAPRVEPETVSGAVTEVLANAMFSSPEQSLICQPVLKTIDSFCRAVPGFNLYFPKTGSLRKAIA